MKGAAENSIWRVSDGSDKFLSGILLKAMRQARVGIVISDFTGNLQLAANLQAFHQINDDIVTIESVFGEDTARRILDKASDKSAAVKSFDVQTPDKSFEFDIEVEGDPQMIHVTFMDVTEERRREKLLRTLLREVSHRSKNLLAIIQSIASQTARKSASLESFLAKFRGRLFSLAESQDLVTDSNWRGSDFFSLARSQFKRYVTEGTEPIRISGDDVHLSPNESLHIGLALHELVVNAASYGALANAAPAIAVTCRQFQDDGQDMIEIVWQEAMGNGSGALENTGEIERRFGSRVLESAVPAAIMGAAEYEILPGEVAYRLVFPASSGSTEDESQ